MLPSELITAYPDDYLPRVRTEGLWRLLAQWRGATTMAQAIVDKLGDTPSGGAAFAALAIDACRHKAVAIEFELTRRGIEMESAKLDKRKPDKRSLRAAMGG